MEYKDYYKILGVSKTATADEIKKAYRKLAVKYHPDKNQGNKVAEEKFKEANEANEVLGNPEKRKKYDEVGENWQQYQQNPYAGGNAGRGRQGGYSTEDFYGDGSQFSSFFESIFGNSASGFGGSRRNSRPQKGQDLETTVDITLEESFTGTSRQFSLNDTKLNLKFKPGTKEGQILRLKGKGNPGFGGGPAGDVMITVHILPHAKFELKGNDLYFDQALDICTAVLGGKIAVQGIDKTIMMNIPEGTDTHKTLRLKGMGMPLFDKPEERGDAYVRMVIHIPSKITPEEKELFVKLSALQAK